MGNLGKGNKRPFASTEYGDDAPPRGVGLLASGGHTTEAAEEYAQRFLRRQQKVEARASRTEARKKIIFDVKQELLKHIYCTTCGVPHQAHMEVPSEKAKQVRQCEACIANNISIKSENKFCLRCGVGRSLASYESRSDGIPPSWSSEMRANHLKLSWRQSNNCNSCIEFVRIATQRVLNGVEDRSKPEGIPNKD